MSCLGPDPSLGDGESTRLGDLYDSGSTLARGCFDGACGAPIFAPNGLMNGTVKVGSGDSDVVVGFAFYFGDAATLMKFANATLQYLKPLFKCATEKVSLRY